MAENIFEELMAEMEKILGGHFKIGVKTEGCNFCFKDLEKEKIRKALQETVKYSLATSRLKNFSFEEKEINDLPSLASAILRLFCHCRKSFGDIFDDQKHFLECPGYQKILIDTFGFFTAQLVSLEARKREKGRLTVIKKAFQNFFKKIFGLTKKTAGCEKINIAALLADFQTSLFSLLAFSMLINSKEKWEIIQKYFPLFKKREIEPEKVIIALTKATEKKRENLTTEEFEKVLQELVQ